MQQKTKYRLFYAFMLLLLLPPLQHKLQVIESGPLKGIYVDAPDTTFTLRGWWDGTYQAAKEKYLNDRTGFRPDLVRLTCQVDFSLFDKCHAGWDLLGKRDQLFQSPYINAYYGLEYCGYDSLRVRALKMKAIQDTLAKMGKTFVLVYAPSKVSSYPEDIPYTRWRPKRGPTNHDTYRHLCDSLGVHQVDMDEWFVSLKGRSKAPVFSKQGIHFTVYGACLAGDSLTHYLERMQHTTVRHPKWDSLERTDDIRQGDDDLSVQLNLIFPYPKETLAYPVIEDLPDTGHKLNVIYLGDSWAAKMMAVGVVRKMNRQCEFWDYFRSSNDMNSGTWSFMNVYDWKGAIRKADCFVIMYTSFNLYQLGNGFIEQAYGYYYPQRKL